jgi:hypothetical protein
MCAIAIFDDFFEFYPYFLVFCVVLLRFCSGLLRFVAGGEVVWEERYFREPTLRSGLYRSASGARERASLERPHSFSSPSL